MQGLKRVLLHPVTMLVASTSLSMLGLFAYFVSGLIVFLVFAVAAGFLMAAHIERIMADEKELAMCRDDLLLGNRVMRYRAREGEDKACKCAVEASASTGESIGRTVSGAIHDYGEEVQ